MTNNIIISCTIVLGFLLFCTGLGVVFKRKTSSETGRKLAVLWGARVRVWWSMVAVFFVAFLTHGIGSIVFFGIISFILLRELITVTPTKNDDYRVLLWSFFMVLPCHYALLFVNWYGLFVILIPVYVFLIVPPMIAATGSLSRFFERAAKIQWALMLCVYCVGYAPALLLLRLEGAPFPNAPLLLFLVAVVQMRETTADLVNALPRTHPTFRGKAMEWEMTWEGALTGTVVAGLAGLLLTPITEFSNLQAVSMALAISVMCEASNMCLAGLRADWGRHGTVIIECHGAMIERIMPICFAAPVFFHLTRFFCLTGVPVGFN